MRFYKTESDHPKVNAQRNLMGRTHYVDPDTLRWHKSRILSARWLEFGRLQVKIIVRVPEHIVTRALFGR